MVDTPNHEYNVPDQGDQNWHEPLNENFEAFEVDIELRDQEANLGNYQPTEGAKFLATDTGVVYVGDGNSWVPGFVHPEYDGSNNEAVFGQTVVAPGVTVDSIGGNVTGGTTLTNIAGNNLSIDSNGQLNAAGGGGGGGGNWTEANNLLEPSDNSVLGIDVDQVTAGELTGSLTSGASLSTIAGDNLSIDSNGQLNASTGGGGGGGISSLSGGDGIDPSSIGDGDTLSVAWGDASGLGSNGEITGGNWTVNSNDVLEIADSAVNGINVSQVKTALVNAETGPLQVFVGGDRALELGPESSGDAGNVLLGNSANSADGVVGATISGGGQGNSPNTVNANHGTVGGGYGNTVNIVGGTVGGGINCKAGGDYSTVAGGELNTASGAYSTVGGGRQNFADFPDSTVGGGQNNDAISSRATVSGGQGNEVNESWGSAGGGRNNTVSGAYGTVGGGDDNTVSGLHATVSGGITNEATILDATVGGGQDNTASGNSSTVGGGQDNTASGGHSVAGGGLNNAALGNFATIGGGAPSDPANADATQNVVYDNYGTVGGGGNNQAGSDDGDNTTAQYATVSGGEGNLATVTHSTVGGGENNEASGEASTVPGGRENTASGNLSFAVGRNATANNDGAFVVGDSTSNSVSSIAADQAVFQQELVSRNTIKAGVSYKFSDFPNISIEPFVPNFGEPHLALASGSGGGNVTVLPGGSLSAGGRVQSFGDDNGVAANFSGDVIIGNLQSDSGSNVVINSNDELAVESSSARHKTGIQPHSTSGGVLDLELREFEYEDTGSEDVGFIAEEVEEHVPEIVTYDDEDRPYGVKYDRVGVHLVPEVRDNRDRLDEIEADREDTDDRIAELEAEIETKDARLEDQRDRIDRLESRVQRETETVGTLREELAEKDDRIDDLEAENEQLRDRLAAIEEQLTDIDGVED